MIKKIVRAIILVYFIDLVGAISFAAVGCTLNDPDRDVKRLFPKSTGYKTDFITVKERGGEELQRQIEQKLGDKLEPLYENMDTPYAYYTILNGKEIIGRIHGINQKGMYGGIQLILATDLDGRIKDFYYQKISSPESKKFRNKAFTDQFKGLTLPDFHKSGLFNSKSAKIKDPTENSHKDFLATMRGIKKNLILLDVFMRGGKYDKIQ